MEKFLLSMPSLQGSIFTESVILLADKKPSKLPADTEQAKKNKQIMISNKRQYCINLGQQTIL